MLTVQHDSTAAVTVTFDLCPPKSNESSFSPSAWKPPHASISKLSAPTNQLSADTNLDL